MQTPKTYIIAEAGVNHNGDIDLAHQLIDAAKDAGADAVKFQTYKTENLVTRNASKAGYQIKNLNESDISQYAMLKRYELAENDFIDLKEYCDHSGIEFLSTPFDEDSADLLNNLVSKYKIGSGEITNFPFLEYVSKKGKPIVLSTGMANLGEVEKAVDIVRSNLTTNSKEFEPLTILHCTTNYPCPYEEVNLRAMVTMKEAFHLPVGYSDHTVGTSVDIAAVALGATIIEKHFTLDRTLSGPDHKASLEPYELRSMVSEIRKIEQALGDGIKRPNKSEEEIMAAARKSITTNIDIDAGTTITEEMVRIRRPGNGIAPSELDKVVGLKLVKSKERGEPLYWKDFKNE